MLNVAFGVTSMQNKVCFMKTPISRYTSFLFIVQILFFNNSFSQQTHQNPITINGKVYDAENSSLSFPVLMIVNLSTQHGIFGNDDGTFVITIFKTDTLIISAIGYSMKKICYTDSVSKSSFYLNLPLKKLQQQLKEVEIFPQRDLKTIERDIQDLGYDEKDYRLTGIDAWSAPLTALYQQYSKKEIDKRRAAQLWNDEKRRELVKELLRLYDKNNLINMPYEKYDDFIDSLHLTDEMMKSWTQYELAIYIKSKYERYTR